MVRTMDFVTLCTNIFKTRKEELFFSPTGMVKLHLSIEKYLISHPQFLPKSQRTFHILFIKQDI